AGAARTVRPVVRAQAPAAGQGVRPPTAPLAVDELTLTTQKEIWFRWFPEDDFTERGVAPASDEEAQALATFKATLAGRPWYHATDATVVSAWQTLVRTIAPERAVHLLRNAAHATSPRA